MEYNHIYFLGIGGIGMSALARFFLHEGKAVAGYDRTFSELTDALSAEGALVSDSEAVEAIPEVFRSAEDTLVVYTPAVPASHPQLRYFEQEGFRIEKRSRMLGVLSQNKYVMAVAGTHGKTTTTTMTAWLNHVSGGGGSAFLGGISKNFDSNLVLGRGDRLAVEADEFDRSFLQLSPDVAVITSVDADHLDIYGTYEAVQDSFSAFVSRIKPGGTLILKEGVELEIDNPEIKLYRYSLDRESDFCVRNLTLIEGGHYSFDLVCPDWVVEHCRLGIPGLVNVENAVAACALLWVAGFDEGLLRKALATFSGVKRRFDFYHNSAELIYMDDYAHHPEELRAAISSFKKMFPDRKALAIFQPHLYTRTRDFYEEFAEALSLADEAWILPIYPAREEPIEGVNSEMILAKMRGRGRVVHKEQLLEELSRVRPDTLITFGAGDIDRFCEPIAHLLKP